MVYRNTYSGTDGPEARQEVYVVDVCPSTVKKQRALDLSLRLV